MREESERSRERDREKKRERERETERQRQRERERHGAICGRKGSWRAKDRRERHSVCLSVCLSVFH